MLGNKCGPLFASQQELLQYSHVCVPGQNEDRMWNFGVTEWESHLGGSVCPAPELDGCYHDSHFIIIKQQKAKPSLRHSHPERMSSLRVHSFAYHNESPLRKTRRVKVSLSSCFNLVGGDFHGIF